MNESPSKVETSSKIENGSAQQYVEIGSNMYVGTKDGRQYTLIQATDDKLRLVEVRNDINIGINASERSFGSVIRDENFNVIPQCLITPTADQKIMKFALKSESSPCKGQGDEIGNVVLSPSHLISSKKDTYTTLDKNVLRENMTFMENSPQMTYTTLTPRQKNLDTAMDDNNYFLTPRTMFTSSPIFPTPLVTKPSRYIKRPRIPLIPPNDSYSPITKPRLGVPRQRRPKYAKSYQYTPQVLHYPTSSSDIYSNLSLTAHDSKTFVSESKTSRSSGSFNSTPSSIEYPRVPNNTPTSPISDLSGKENVFSVNWMPHITDELENDMSDDPREVHNEKERKRRRRIKIACQSMRSLVPCVTEKTDNATVFERSVLFVEFVRELLGGQNDLEFIEHNYRVHDV